MLFLFIENTNKYKKILNVKSYVQQENTFVNKDIFSKC